MTSYSYEKNVWETIWEFLPGIIKFLSLIALVINVFSMVTIFSSAPKPAGGLSGPKTAIRDYNFSVGPKDSKVQVLYFLDYQCPACKSNNPNMATLKKDYATSVQFVYKHFPLKSKHANALNAARAVQAAGRQDKFTEYGDLVFTNQEQGLGSDNLSKWAGQIGLDTEKWNQDRNSSQLWSQVDQDLVDITDLSLPKSGVSGVTKASGTLNDLGTPTVVILKNGEVYDWWSSVLPVEDFKKKLDEALA
jgi:protein-disulfide isomerase